MTAVIVFITSCKKNVFLEQPAANPVAVFDEAWKIMDERYSFFVLKNVDWKEQYDAFRPEINDQMTEKELFKAISDMLKTVHDGHVSLISNFDTSVYTGFYIPYPRNFNLINIENLYLTDSAKHFGPIKFNIIDSVGYAYYHSFNDMISDSDIDSLVDALHFAKGLVLDVRANFGGNSNNVDKLCRRFIDQERIVYYERTKTGKGHGDFSDPRPHSLKPGGLPYKMPIVLLTNRTCYSACNDFASFMSTLPNVTIMGDQTGGGGGLPYEYILSNGWHLNYTGSITLSPSLQPIEQGVYPGQFVFVEPIDEIQGIDPIVDSAIHFLRK